MTIQEFATQNDCAIIRDGEGNMALLKRRYTDCGMKIPQHKPDPCDFMSEDEWPIAIELGIGEKWIC
jgi:hypothetical protein